MMKPLPQTNWRRILQIIKLSGELAPPKKGDVDQDHKFWTELGIFEKAGNGKLTLLGKAIFESAYIRRGSEYITLLRNTLLTYPPTIAIQQYLWGIANVNIEQVLTVLKTTGFWTYTIRQPLTHFLDLLNAVDILSYNKKTKHVKILISPDTVAAPKNIFIDPSRPYSNIMWIKRVIGECEDFIYWLDKHFQKEALEWLWASADSNKIREIRILSLDLGNNNLDSTARKSYRRFKKEMEGKSINATWATIDPKLIMDDHDRWIIGGNDYLRNIPNVNAISSGQRSEMNYSDNYSEALSAFEDYWKESSPVSGL